MAQVVNPTNFIWVPSLLHVLDNCFLALTWSYALFYHCFFYWHFEAAYLCGNKMPVYVHVMCYMTIKKQINMLICPSFTYWQQFFFLRSQHICHASIKELFLCQKKIIEKFPGWLSRLWSYCRELFAGVDWASWNIRSKIQASSKWRRKPHSSLHDRAWWRWIFKVSRLWRATESWFSWCSKTNERKAQVRWLINYIYVFIYSYVIFLVGNRSIN